jgi:hypothetical protein
MLDERRTGPARYHGHIEKMRIVSYEQMRTMDGCTKTPACTASATSRHWEAGRHKPQTPQIYDMCERSGLQVVPDE